MHLDATRTPDSLPYGVWTDNVAFMVGFTTHRQSQKSQKCRNERNLLETRRDLAARPGLRVHMPCTFARQGSCHYSCLPTSPIDIRYAINAPGNLRGGHICAREAKGKVGATGERSRASGCGYKVVRGSHRKPNSLITEQTGMPPGSTIAFTYM